MSAIKCCHYCTISTRALLAEGDTSSPLSASLVTPISTRALLAEGDCARAAGEDSAGRISTRALLAEGDGKVEQ